MNQLQEPATDTLFQRALHAAYKLDAAELDTLRDHLRIRSRWLERFDWRWAA